MKCSNCNIDMRIQSTRNELMMGETPKMQTIQDMVCPKCKRQDQVIHPVEIIVKNG